MWIKCNRFLMKMYICGRKTKYKKKSNYSFVYYKTV